MQIDRTARRILGALLEKRWTTPEAYPLTLNSLVLACNQKNNRDPVTQLEEFIVEGCLYQLRLEGLVTVVERDVGRTTRYAERLSEKLDLSRQQQAILCELMLRGPQSVGELYRRCERMAHFENEGEVEGLLRGMADRHWTQLLPRETGQRHQRWRHLFAPADETPDAPQAQPRDPAPPPADPSETQALVDALGLGGEAAAASNDPVAALRLEIVALREEIGVLRARVKRLEDADTATM